MPNWWPFSWTGFGSNAFSETVDGSIDRANQRFLIPADSLHYIKQRTRTSLNEGAEWVWQNFGVVKEGVAGIARHTIGKGVSLQIDAEGDPKQIELAERDFEIYFLTPERCDLSGRRNGYEAQTTAIEQRLVRGEFFSALTENPEWGAKIDNEWIGEPCFQLYDSEEVGNPRQVPTDKLIIDGVELDKNTRATGYYVRDIKGDYQRIDRSRMVHWYKPHAINQTRGISDFAQAVNPLVDIHELKRLATRNAKVQQFLALVLKNVMKKKGRGAFGAIDNARKNADGTADVDSSQVEKIIHAAGGGIFYAGENGEAQLVTSNSPSPLVEAFITDLLMRDVCSGWGVPAEFFWNIAKLNGGNTRFILARADLFFQILGERLIDRFCTPIAFRYLSHRIQVGKLKPFQDPNWALKMSWQMPPRVTVDNGRENEILIELLANGLITMREYCNARGINYKATMRQWIREPLEFIRMAEEEGAPPEYMKRLRDNLPVWRGPKPGSVQAPGADPANVRNVVDDTLEEKEQAA